MTSPLEMAATQALYSAVDTTVGIIVRTNDVQRAKAVLYRFRRELGDPALKRIQIRPSPTNPDSEIWLIKMKEDQEEVT